LRKTFLIFVTIVTILLSSTVFSQNLVPINRAYIIVTGDNGYARVLSGPDGTFEIKEGLAEGIYSVFVGATGYIYKTIKNVKIKANKVTDLGDIKLEISGVIKGKVIGVDGKPIAGVMVNLKGKSVTSAAMTRSDGTFIFDTNIDTGTYTIIAYPFYGGRVEYKTINVGFMTIQVPFVKELGQSVQGYSTTEKSGISATKGKTTEVVIELKVSGIISGKVTDKQGKPIKGVLVFAYRVDQTGSMNGFWAITDDNGNYKIATNLATGKYNVTPLMPKGYVWNIRNAKQVNVKEGQEVKNVNFKLEKSGTISGTVKWQDGKPVSGAMVMAASQDGKYMGWAETDLNGNFRIESGLGTGQYMIIAMKGNAFNKMPVQAKVVAGQETKNVVITIQGSPVFEAIIKGKVTDNKGKPLRNVKVSCLGASDSTDSNGLYELKISFTQSPTNVEVKASLKGYKEATKSVKVEAGKIYNVDLKLEPKPWGILKGRVLGMTSAVAKKNAKLTLALSSTSITLGESVTLSGQLSPARGGKVTIYYSYNNGAFTKLADVSLSNGKYSYNFKPTKTGVYKFKAEWPGDNEYNKAVSSITTLNVVKQEGKITPNIQITVSKTSANVGDTITVSGTISPFKGSTKVTIVVTGPGGTKQYDVTSTNGKFSYSFKVDSKGTWKVKAVIPSSDNYNTASSSELTISVSEAPQQKKCIIATVTFGSEVSPEVNFLRNFRNNLILKTFSGRRFYVAFDAFYYSWSTPVAMYIEEHPYLKNIVKPILYPLLGALKVTAFIVMPWFMVQPEIATITAGIIASSLLGLIYVFPIAFVIHMLRTRFNKSKPIPDKLIKTNGYILVISLTLLSIGVLFFAPWLTTIASSILVLSTIAFAGITPLYILEKRKIIK